MLQRAKKKWKNESIQSGFMCERSFWSLCKFIKGLELPALSDGNFRMFMFATTQNEKLRNFC